MSTPLISICICTYKRPAGLAKVLASIAAMHRPTDCRIEVLVVDNDGVGSASAVVEAARSDGSAAEALRYVCEPRSGVGYARSRCLQEAEGEWVAFIDDDEWAEPQWLEELWRCLRSGPYDGVFGPVLASFETEPPAWLVDSGIYQRPRFPTGTRLDWPDCASGNAIFRKSLGAEVGDFNPAFAASGGEDSDFFWRCLNAGAVFVWCDSAIAQENIPPARMTREWVRRRFYLGGRNYTRLSARHGHPGAYWLLAVRGLVAMLVFGACALIARLGANPKALAYEARFMGGWGKLTASILKATTDYGDTGASKTQR